jgi:hypothetical protein
VRFDGRPSEADRAEADKAVSAGEACVALTSNPAVASSLDDWNLDATWLNALEREVGKARVLEAGRLTRSSVDPCAWLVVPRAAAAAMDSSQIQFIRGWTESGGVLIVELPVGPWAESFRFEVDDRESRKSARLTRFDTPAPKADARAELTRMPIRANVLSFRPAKLVEGRDFTVPVEFDNGPGVIMLPVGKGATLALLADFGRVMATMQQGTLDSGFRLPPVHGSLGPGVSVTAAAVYAPELLAAETPFVDVLQHQLFLLADTVRPLPRAWLFPGVHRGGLMITHGQSGAAERSELFADVERQAKVRSTVFAMAGGQSPEAVARLARSGGEIQLEWAPDRSQGAPVRPLARTAWLPARRAMNLTEQLETLASDAAPYPAPTATRTPRGLWPADMLSGFGMLQRAGVAMDLSLGPTSAALSNNTPMCGYLFGTGYPFRAIDRTGFRFGVVSLPTTFTDSASGYSLERVKSLLRSSADGYHTLVVGDWNASTMAERPSFDALAGWREAIRLSDELDIWRTTPSEWMRFAARRARIEFHSTFSPEERRLTVEVSVPRDDAGSASARLPATAGAIELPALSIPSRFRGGGIREIIRNGVLVDVAELSQSGDLSLTLLPFEEGASRIVVSYLSMEPAAPL